MAQNVPVDKCESLVSNEPTYIQIHGLSTTRLLTLAAPPIGTPFETGIIQPFLPFLQPDFGRQPSGIDLAYRSLENKWRVEQSFGKSYNQCFWRLGILSGLIMQKARADLYASITPHFHAHFWTQSPFRI